MHLRVKYYVLDVATELHSDDLKLATACAAGDARALATFDEQYLARVPSYLAWLREPATALEAMTVRLRVWLLTATERPAPILGYDGSASLHAFIRVAAVRQALAQQPTARDTAPPTMSSSWHDGTSASVAPTSACPTDAVMADFIERGTDDPSRPAIEAHVAHCAACRHLLSLTALSIEFTDAAPTLTRGDAIGRYVVLGVAGKGAMGVVYAAYDPDLDRKVAIKLLNRTDPTDPVRRARIIREAQAMARVNHPNVVPAYEVGELHGRIFLVMEYVDGVTLRSWQHAEGRSWEQILRAYAAAGSGLLAAHRSGLVHRDFKPDNVLVGVEGRPRVADFGLARVEGTFLATPTTLTLPSVDDPSLTLAGAILGTPAYMAPEQLRGEPADARSDQFSFCVALYEALHRAPPFSGATVPELVASVSAAAVRPVPPSSPVPPIIERTLRRGLAADPAARFPSMAELLDALSLDPHRDPAAAPTTTRRFLLIGMLILLIGTTFLANVVFGGHAPISAAGMFQLGVVSFLAMLGVALFLWRRLQANSFHWGITRISVVITGQMAVLRWIALVANLELRWIFALDLTVYAAGLATTTWLYVPSGWPSVVLCVAGAIALVSGHVTPDRAQWIYPLATIFVFVPWYRAANEAPKPVGTSGTRSAG